MSSFNSRLKLILLLFSAFTLIILCAFFYKMVIRHSRANQIGAALAPLARRGTIYDRNGYVLAMQANFKSVVLWRPNVKDLRGELTQLAQVLPLDVGKTYSEIARSSRRFFYIARKISPSLSTAVEKEIASGKLPGITLRSEPGRIYPAQTLGSHILGYVGVDNQGLSGVEYSLQKRLSPHYSVAQGRVVPGDNVTLTLDVNIEYFLRSALVEPYNKLKATALMALVVDAQSGQILGYEALPDFDPNHYSASPESARTDRLVETAYEPGSVFKVFSMASFLDSYKTDPDNDLIDTHGGIFDPPVFQRYNIRPIRDLGNFGIITPTQILIHSSNVGMSELSLRISQKEFYDKLRAFGFGAQVDIPLPGQSYGILRLPRDWSVRSKPTISFGQEIGVSMIQMAQAFTALTNNGVLLRPEIVQSISAPSGEVVDQAQRDPIREVVSAATAQKLLKMMGSVVNSPQSIVKRVRIAGLDIGAKSGTAQRIGIKTGEYDRYVASFVAVVPLHKPRVIVYAVAVNPHGRVIFGGTVVSPIVRQIIERLIPYLGIQTTQARKLSTSSQGKNLRAQRLKQAEATPLSVMPSLVGLSKKDALAVLKSRSIIYGFTGSGVVVSTRPRAGQHLSQNQRVQVKFSS